MRPDEPMIEVRAALRSALGDDVLRRLLRPDPRLDALGFVGVWALVVGLGVALVALPFGVPWALCLVLQGFALQLLVLLFHDLFLHRSVGGPRLSWLLGIACTLPLFIRPTAYTLFHRRHHRFINTDADSEAFKQRVDTRWKRLALSTLPGFLLQRAWPIAPEDITPRAAARLRLETLLVRIYAVALLAALCVWPTELGLAYLLPLATTMPLASVLRIILEHAEADPQNPFHAATYYRTGLWTRALFLWDCGDCHLVHHVFDQIPFYRMGRAVELTRPLLLRAGVAPRDSLTQLLRGYYVDAIPHRTRWPDP
jgi:fatty acid desaturase